MKPLQGDTVNNNSCSCTSCDSKTESDRQTLKRLLVQGSRINRLLTGKYYIHLKESNLLGKLIKTRALYDALRSQLLSSSESSKTDLKPGSSIEQRKALVNLVDAGAFTGSRKLSECCSCCTCSSKYRLRENVQKARKNRQAHAGGNIASRSSLVSKQETSEAKNIKSDPCTSVCKHEKYKKSREILEKICPRSTIERDRLFTATNNRTLKSLNNGRLRKSYHKLKRAKAYPNSYMENIGEGGKTIKKLNLPQENIALKKTESSKELLLKAEKKIKECFERDRKALQKNEPKASSVTGNTTKENIIHPNKTAIKMNDEVERKCQAQRFANRSRRINQSRKENINDTSSTSSTSILTENSCKIGKERRKCHSRAEKRKQYSLTEYQKEIEKKLKEYYALELSRQTSESEISPQTNLVDVANIIKNLLPYCCTTRKESIKSITATTPLDTQQSINSIKKGCPVDCNKSSSKLLNKINKSKSKLRSSALIHKKLRMLSAPMRFKPRPQICKEPQLHEGLVCHKKLCHCKESRPCQKPLLPEVPRLPEKPCRHEKTSNFKQKHKCGSHALKRCICSLKIKINETKSRVGKNARKDNLNITVKESTDSKNFLPSMETSIKASNLNIHNPKCTSGVSKVVKNQGINKRTTQNETNAHLIISKKCVSKCTVTDNIQSCPAQDIINNTKLSIHESKSDSTWKKVGGSKHKSAQSKIKFEVKSTSYHTIFTTPQPKEKWMIQNEHAGTGSSYNIDSSIHTSKWVCYDKNMNTEAKGRCENQRGESNTRLRKVNFKDESITTEELRKLQNQSVQTSFFYASEQKRETQVFSSNRLEKNKQNTSNPNFSMELFKEYNKNLKIRKMKCVKCGDGIRQLQSKQSQTSSSTGKSKLTRKKHGLRRCFCTIKLGKQEKKKNNKRQVSKMVIVRPDIKVERSQTDLRPASHVTPYDRPLPYKCDTSICSPKKPNVLLINREENIKTVVRKPRSNSSLTSQSIHLPRTEKIHSVLIYHKSATIKRGSCTFKIYKNGKHYKKSSTTDTKSYLVAERMYPHFQRGIMVTKRKHSNQLRPYESKYSKPFKYAPSICNPYEYLESNKSSTFKHLGISTEETKMKSKSSDTRAFRSSSKTLFVQTDFQERMSIQKFKSGVPSKCNLYECLAKESSTFKHSGISTEKTKMKSKSSDTRAFRSSSKTLFLQTDNPKRMSILKFNNMGPSKCNPYECLAKTSSTFKHSRIGTKKTKMKSKSSYTRAFRSTSKPLCVQSDIQKRNMFNKNMRKYSELSHLPQHAREMYLNKSLQQSMNMGSNFSFNIEFYKSITPENKFNQNSTKNVNVPFSNNKQEGNVLANRHSCNRKYRLGNKGVSPANRCFCTLKISKKDEQHRSSKSLAPFGTRKITQVYDVNTAIAENKTKTLKNSSIHSYYSTNSSKNASSHTKVWQYFNKNPSCGFSISMIAFKAKHIQSYLHESKYKLSQVSSRDQSLLNFGSNGSVQFESEFSCEIDYLKNICSKKQWTPRSTQSQIDVVALRRRTLVKPEMENVTNSSPLTGVQSLLRKCYCTMNIQVAQQKGPRNYQRQNSKLLDYECEPGICVPGDCDPYECQKLIMKRLMRKVSRMSGTDNKVKSSCCLTTSTHACSRRLQSGPGREPKHRAPRAQKPKAKPTGLKYQTLPRAQYRQAVRVGSKFSFDIEFSKGSSKPTPTKNIVKVSPKRPTASKASKTRHKHRHNIETQSVMKQIRHKASSVSPMLKRCFCTLKLQKKGRQQKARELRVHQGTSTPPKYNVKPILSAEAGQNTKGKFSDLLPYECEPGICVPGECDPYKCLELIKKRNRHTKDFGTESIANTTSSSTMSKPYQKPKRKRTQSRNMRAKRIKSRNTAVRSKPSVMSIDRQIKPSKQAVKISSNFSFNIEFYKDKTGTDSDKGSSEPYVQKKQKQVKRVPKNVHAHRKLKESSSQEGRTTHDTDAQINVAKQGQSTMTSGFLKRCFCTASLQGFNVDPKTGEKINQPLTKFKNCFCHMMRLSSASKRHRVKSGNVGPKKVAPKSGNVTTQTPKNSPYYICECKESNQTQTRERGPMQTRERYPNLLPYECEPGVCVPDFCDPNECIKLIRKRLAKDKMTGTARPRIKSTSSNVTSSNPSRAIMVQSRPARPTRRVKRRTMRDRPPREKIISEVVKSSPVSPRRQAVRIGSNISFNIEFYKDRSPNTDEVQAAATTVKKSRNKSGFGANRRIKTRSKGLRERRLSVLSRDTQADPTKKRDVGLGPILKRCFCTLKLNKQKQSKAHIKAKTVAKPKKIEQKHECLCTPPMKPVATLHTRSVTTTKIKAKRSRAFPHKLKPYECEPGICIPGECDPNECLKLINKRLMNSSGTSTERRDTRTTSNMTKHYRRKQRDSETQHVKHTKPIKARKEKRLEPKSTSADKQHSKQAVKLGSSFNFDIEFSKNKSHGDPIAPKREKAKKNKSKYTKQTTNSRNKRAQRTESNRDMDSQVLNSSLRSTMTGTEAPFLKRCFCTLQLHCKTDNQGSPFKCTTCATKPEKGKGKVKVPKNLLTCECGKFQESDDECPPGKCKPDACDPYECNKTKRKRRPTQKSRSISSSTDESKDFKSRKMQATSHTPSRKNDKAARNDKVQGDGPKRRAHRITSSFSINVEFTTDKSPPSRKANIAKSEGKKGTRKSTQRESRKSTQKDIRKSTRRDSKKSTQRDLNKDMKELVKKTKSIKNVSCFCKKESPQDYPSDSEFKKSDSLGTSAALLKKCFCTLKLEKKGKHQEDITTLKYPDAKSKHPEPATREIGTKTKKIFGCFKEPKEKKTKGKKCQCVTDTREPHVTKEAVTKEMITNELWCPCQKQEQKCMCIKCPVIDDILRKQKKNCECDLDLSKGKKSKRDKLKMKTATPSEQCSSAQKKRPKQPEINRQSRNYMSNFRFDVEFSRESPSSKSSSSDQAAKAKMKLNTIKPPRHLSKSNDRESKTVDKSSRKSSNRQSVQAHVEPPAKGSKMRTPSLKRCLCALSLLKNEAKRPDQTEQPKVETQAKRSRMMAVMAPSLKRCLCTLTLLKSEAKHPSRVKTSDKKTSTKGKYTPIQKLSPNECLQGGICTAEECTRKKGVRRMSRTRPTNDKPTTRMSVTSIANTLLPGRTSRRTQYKGEPYSPTKVERIVEEPRFPFLHGKNAKQGVKITSNFNINVEFFKELLPPNMDNNRLDMTTSNKTKTKSPYLKQENGRSRQMTRFGKKTVTCARVEEIRPITLFSPKEQWVQYQIQPATQRHFKTNTQELETIMSYAFHKHDRIDNSKAYCGCRKCNSRMNSRRQGATKISKYSEFNQFTFKKMLYCCKKIFTKRSNKENILSSVCRMEFKRKVTNKQSLSDMLKYCNSERHPQSLKVEKVTGKNDYKKKYYRFQSKDTHQRTISNNRGIKFFKKSCQHYPTRFKQTIPLHDKVRFTTLRTGKAFKMKPSDSIVLEQKKDFKPVSFLFRSPKFQSSENVKYLKLCPCCGGNKIIRTPPSVDNVLDMKNKILEYSKDTLTTVSRKDLIVIPTKCETPEEETTLPEKNKNEAEQPCNCCVCKSISKPKTDQSKNASVCESVLCKKEAEKHAQNLLHTESIEYKKNKCVSGTAICAPESEKEALGVECGSELTPNQTIEKKRFELQTAEDKETKLNKFEKRKSTSESLLVREPVLNINKLKITSPGYLIRYLHRAVSGTKGTYRKFQSYVRDPKRAWRKSKVAANNGSGVGILQRLKLVMKSTKEDKNRKDRPVTNYSIYSNYANRKKGFHPKQPGWRRRPGSGFRWSPFRLRKRPWLSLCYRCAGFCPHCLTVLQIWRQYMDVLLFLLVVSVWSPCLFGIELCKALKCCFL